jgi:hypothetical protein
VTMAILMRSGCKGQDDDEIRVDGEVRVRRRGMGGLRAFIITITISLATSPMPLHHPKFWASLR